MVGLRGWWEDGGFERMVRLKGYNTIQTRILL